MRHGLILMRNLENWVRLNRVTLDRGLHHGLHDSIVRRLATASLQREVCCVRHAMKLF